MKVLSAFFIFFYALVVQPAYSHDFSFPAFMTLPEKCEEVPLYEIKDICEVYGLNDLWNKIESDPPPKVFKSDGCSLWVDSWRGVNLYPICFFHDLKYWSGRPGEEDERLIADLELMINVMEKGLPIMALVMFVGVRVCGHECLGMPFSWGFGRTSREDKCPLQFHDFVESKN
jgi:hypothetical protein